MVNIHDHRIHWLDEALAGETAEIKARVLGILLRYNVDPENEFFMIFVAIGQLLVLVEDTPQDWQRLFENFQQDLNQWTQQNIKTLEGVTQQSQMLVELINQLKELTSLTSYLHRTTQDWRQGLKELGPILTGLSELSRQTVSDNQALLTRLNRIEHQQSQFRTLILSINLFVVVLLCAGMGWIVAGLSQLEYGQRVQGQRVSWLLEKANRWECWQGIKAPDSPECN